MVFNILVKKDADLYIAHCLELDIVATSSDFGKVKKDMVDLIKAQINYAFSNNNLDYLYHPAPSEVWQEFYACKNQSEQKIDIKSFFENKKIEHFVPPWIIARTCISKSQPCHA
jgi:hypothetical protein